MKIARRGLVTVGAAIVVAVGIGIYCIPDPAGRVAAVGILAILLKPF